VPEIIRILLADDHPLFRDGVALSLDVESDLEVIAQTGSAEEAVELARRLKPDVAILDISMPKMGGVVAAAQIAEQESNTRIIMLTVSEDRDSLFADLKAGAHGYVLKGVSASELRSVVRRIAGGETFITPALAAQLVFEFSRPREDPISELTARERAVLDRIAQGLTNREIAVQLHLSEKTVKHYVTLVLQKLHVRSRTEAALLAVTRDNGLGE
jgi:two-component system, NarL family, nitrate/nitrite response regulator NarL